MKKALVIRHAEEPRTDRVATWMDENGIAQEVVVPAHGEELPADTSDYDALIVYGGVQSANDGESKPYIAEELDFIADWVEADRPALGICLGAQLISKCLGGEVAPHPENRFEIGFGQVSPVPGSNSFLSEPSYFFQWHGEGFTIPESCEKLATGDVYPNQAFRCGTRTYGFQFHPEATLEIMRQWQAYNEGKLESRLGAHSPERQLEDERRYGVSMHTWLTDFLSNWAKAW